MPRRQPRALSNRFATLLTALLLAAGLYFPTSHAETISLRLYLVSGAMLLSILALLLLRRSGVLSALAVVNAVAINAIILVCTLFSPFTEFAYGGYAPVLLVSALYCVSLKDIGLTALVRKLFDLANAINIALAVCLLLQVPAVTQFFLDNYAFGYDELLPYMLSEGKPALTFGSHSLAGFFYYLLFYLTFQTFVKAGSKLNLFFAICYVALLTCLYSFTALVFVVVALVQLVLHFHWHKSVAAGLIAATMLLVFAAVALPRLDILDDFKADLVEVMHREENGLLGRYSAAGGVSSNLEYIAEHPFSPIRLGLSRQLWYADSGPVEYLLKGSFPLLLAVYGGAFLFFRKNLNSKRAALFLFVVFLGFEVGYSNLQHIRTQCFLPFPIVYLNGLDAQESGPHAALERFATWQYA